MAMNVFLQQHKGGDFSDEAIREKSQTLPWDQKTETRAALYASFDNSRWVVLEAASRNPDLIDLSLNAPYYLFCWTPECTVRGWDKEQMAALTPADLDAPKVSGLSLMKYSYTPPRHYTPGHYKYVIVPQGMAGMSTSSRLLYLLSYCECVVLLMGGHLQYHISARLVPWVHYVPLSPSGAEVAAKVRWLQQHDALAKQIAENGHNFGKSYLRLEDYLCYAATTIEAVAEVMKNTTALHGFSPIKI